MQEMFSAGKRRLQNFQTVMIADRAWKLTLNGPKIEGVALVALEVLAALRHGVIPWASISY